MPGQMMTRPLTISSLIDHGERNPALADAAVTGVPHPKRDERPVRIAVRAPGQVPDPDALRGFLDGRIEGPDAVALVDAPPRHATGKMPKNRLRAEGAQLLTAAS